MKLGCCTPTLTPIRLTDEQLSACCRALGHPARVAIVRILAELGTCICGDIVETLAQRQHPLAQSTVSQHLKVLKEAGIIQGEIDGPRVCYCLEPAMVAGLKEAIVGL